MVKTRRRRARATFSLFPFLSVLGCAIGVLIVIISAQNIVALGSADMVLDVGGTEREREPVYVECTREGLLIHPQRIIVPIAELRRDVDSAFAALLDSIQLSEDRQYLLLLVRPDGIASYDRAMEMATHVWRNIRVGKDALLPGRGRVIFSGGGPTSGPL